MLLVRILKSRRTGKGGRSYRDHVVRRRSACPCEEEECMPMAVLPRSRCIGRLETPPVPIADLAHVARWGADSARASTVCSTHVAESLGSGLSGKASPLPGACSHTCQHPQHRETDLTWLVQTKKHRQRFFMEQAEKDTPCK